LAVDDNVIQLAGQLVNGFPVTQQTDVAEWSRN
jgi:hypothetical protein